MSIKELASAFERRWRNLVKKSQRVGLRPPDKGALWQKVLDSYRNGFRCNYCGNPLMISDPIPPHSRSFSLDHKVSIYLGGDSSINNFAIVCHRCNIIKGTMTAATFVELLHVVPSELLDKAFDEIFHGRLADKLGREEMIA